MKASTQRSHLTHQINQARKTSSDHCLTSLSPHQEHTLDFPFHYSFDFAQQITYPSNLLQPGPLYFLVPGRCQIIGVHADSFLSQVNYLIDEAVSCGKGVNCVFSLLHHFLSISVLEKNMCICMQK